jgi:hypothetical protein
MSAYGIPISELKEIADLGNSMSDGGNVINLSDMGGDDLGMGLLSNTNVHFSRNDGPANTVNISAPPPLSSDINITPLEPLDMMNIDIPLADNMESFGGGGYPNITISRDPPPLFGSDSNISQPYLGLGSGSTMDPETEKKEKFDLINKLNRLEAKGFPVTRKYTMDNSLDEMKTEFERLVDARQLEQSVKFQRQMLVGFATGLEMMNEKFNPLDWKMDGWSESVHESIEDFDEIFEELYDKYKGKGNMPPEAKLVFKLAGSGFMFHISNSFFRAKAPSMDDIFANNPQLRAQFAQAAAQSAGPGFGNFMGMSMGLPPQQGSGQAPPTPRATPMPGGPGGAFFQSPQVPQNVAAMEPSRTARKEMKGPSGVDDILNTFREVRESEVSFGSPSAPFGGVGGGFGMPLDGIPPAMNNQRSQAFNSPATMAASELQSIASDDLGSVGTSATASRGGSRKRKAVPVGNMVTLNV